MKAETSRDRWITRGGRIGPIAARYIVRELVFPALVALVGFALLSLAIQVLPFADLVINRGLGLGEVAQIALYQIVPAVGASLPFATLIGSLIGLTRLRADQELLALEAGGVAPLRVGAPVLTFAAVMTACALAVSFVAAPRAARGLEGALARILHEHPAATLRAGTVQRLGDFRLEAREVSEAGDRLRGVMLWVPSIGETFFAREATLEPIGDERSRLTLDEGILLTSPEPSSYLRFGHMVHVLDLSDARPAASSVELLAMAGPELRRVARGDTDPQRRRDAAVTWQRRVALPLATFWFGALALPLVLWRSHATRASAVLMGIAATVLFYGLLQIGNALLRNPSVPAAAAVWLPVLAWAAIVVAAWLAAWRKTRRPAAERGRRGRAASADAWPGRVRRALLDRYVLTLFAEMALLCFLALLLLFVIGDVVDNLQWFVKYRSTLDEVLRFYAARMPVMAARVVPMALLVAASLTMSLLIVRGEMVGIWACGISTVRAVRSILLLCIPLAVAYSGLQNEIVPRASARASYLKQTEIKNRSQTAIRSSLWYRRGNLLYLARTLDPLAGEAREVTVYQLDPEWLPTSRTDAAIARHAGHGVWRLESPTRVEVTSGLALAVEAPAFAELGEDVPADVDSSHLTIGDLRRAIREVEEAGYDATPYRVDLQQKLASPLACLLLPLLGLIVATAGPPFWTPAQALVLCVLEGVSYIVLTGVAVSLGYGRFLPPTIAGFGPIVLMTGAVGGVVLGRGRRA